MNIKSGVIFFKIKKASSDVIFRLVLVYKSVVRKSTHISTFVYKLLQQAIKHLS